MDDAFLKLIEAEEKESEMETKRKLESDDVKDVLIKRRMKQAKTKETVVYGNEDSASDSEDDLVSSCYSILYS
jgi:hypothetical protein